MFFTVSLNEMKQGILFFKAIHQQAKFVVVIFCCLLSVSVFGQKLTKAPCKNHLQNYNFAMGKMGWTVDNVEATIESSGKNQYLKIGHALSPTGGMGRVKKSVPIPKVFGVYSSLYTNISCWAKSDNTDGAHVAMVYIYFLDGQDILGNEMIRIYTETNWKRAKKKIDVPAGTKRISIDLRGEGSHFDNICVAFACQKTEPRP